MFKGNGQINMNSTFGKEIYNICKLDDVRNIFEVGTWNGQGSTCCVMNAIIKKENSILYSLEGDNNMYNKAKQYWSNYKTNNKLILLNGVIHKEIVDYQNNNELFVKEWYDGEYNVLKTSNIIDINNITNIDLIILDGGEYTTQGDFNILIKKKPKYIALDDTNVYKCKDIRKYLLDSKEWTLYKENTKERNGWSIFQKKNI